MKLTIDIPDDVYKIIKNEPYMSRVMNFGCILTDAIANGTPLEKELVAELLDLWAEIDIYEAPIYDQAYCRGLKKAMEFINNRITELKGE